MPMPIVGPKSGPYRQPAGARWLPPGPVIASSSPSHRPITRRAFGAYVPDLWIVQYYLSELGYDPGALDGLWGAQTQAAAAAFAQAWGTIAPTDLSSAVAGSNAFGVALRAAAQQAGLDMTIVPPSSGVGGSGVRPEAGPQEVNLEGEEIVGRAPLQASMLGGILPMALLGLGAFFLFGRKKGR